MDPPARPEDVAAYERVAGFSLPGEFTDFLAHTGAVIGMTVHNGYWIGGLDALGEMARAGSLPGKVAGHPAIPVATDGGGNAFLLSGDGRVWRWDHETRVVTAASGSFAGFLGRVVDDWTAFLADTAGWHFLT